MIAATPIKLPPRAIEAAAQAIVDHHARIHPLAPRWDALPADQQREVSEAVHVAIAAFLRVWR